MLNFSGTILARPCELLISRSPIVYKMLHCYPVGLRHSHRLDGLTRFIATTALDCLLQNAMEKLLSKCPHYYPADRIAQRWRIGGTVLILARSLTAYGYLLWATGNLGSSH